MRRKKIKIITVLAAMLLALSAPASYGQADGFFEDYLDNGGMLRDGDPTEVPGIWGIDTVTDYETEEELPAGDGLWLLAAGALLYALVRTRRHRAAAMAVATVALALGTTQCRKQDIDELAGAAGERIYISFTTGGVTRTDIDVTTGKITWNEGDRVYVTCQGRLVSTEPLTATPRANARTADISGTITTTMSLGETPELTFYYVGKGVEFTPVEGSETLTFNIAEQRSHHGVALNDAGEYQIGRADTVRMKKDGQGHYVPKMTNAKTFTPLTSVLSLNMSQLNADGQDAVLSAAKARNTMVASLADGTLSYRNSGAADRRITFKAGANACITVMEAAKNEAPAPDDTVRINFTAGIEYSFIGIKGGIKRGRVYADIINHTTVNPIPVTPKPRPVPEDWENGENPHPFTVGDTRTAHFSQGNLQWNPTDAWRFGEHQYDVIGEGNTGISPTYTGWIDLFGWGTSGYHQAADTYNHNYMPYSTSTDVVDETANKYGYGPSVGVTPAGPADQDQSAGQIEGSYYDWGIHNAIGNGGGTPDYWQTLSSDEWGYLFNSRAGASQLWGQGKVSGICGMIVLPDDWALPAGLGFTPGASEWANTYTYGQWSLMEAAGAVFLPAGGWRYGTEMHCDAVGYYWSSSHYLSGNGHSLYFAPGDVRPDFTDGHRCCGFSVRLAHIVSNSGYGNAHGYGNGGNW